MYLWRALDCEVEVLDVLVQLRRNKQTALNLMRKLLESQGFAPAEIATDKLPSYGAALEWARQAVAQPNSGEWGNTTMSIALAQLDRP